MYEFGVGGTTNIQSITGGFGSEGEGFKEEDKPKSKKKGEKKLHLKLLQYFVKILFL